MKKSTLDQRLKIAHFGAFDHDSYGDLIFPFVVEHFLPEFQFVHVSPTGKRTQWPDAKPTISVSEAFQINDWDGVLVGGGDIVDFVGGSEVARVAESTFWNESPLLSEEVLFSLWGGASLLASKLNIPCAWNCPGVPRELISKGDSYLASKAIQSVEYLAVRDIYSADRLAAMKNNTLAIVPDSALMINEVWPRDDLKINDPQPLILSLTPSDLQYRFSEVESLISLLLSNNSQFDGKAIILPLMRWQKFEYQNKFSFLQKKFNISFGGPNLSLKECALEISRAGAYIGNSLHGLITALSYERPAIHIKPIGLDAVTKYKGFSHFFKNGDCLLSNTFTGVNIPKPPSHKEIDDLKELVVMHFDRIRGTLTNSVGIDKQKPWDEVCLANDEEVQILSLYGLTPFKLLEGRDIRIEHLSCDVQGLNQAISDRDAQLQALSQTVTKRDDQIQELHISVGERDIRIEHLSCDIQGLNQAISDRDAQLQALSQTVTERDDQIQELHISVGERDIRIEYLSCDIQRL
ncbi:polysaccharide pyruvyl transferase family protein, partial [Polynucleobacter sp. AM-26B4]|uniref:polysaccharide pyruvyl transferase family protein n=1 Tax=Polynucleobacter sp. AM-26B4 TaxID=2689103 RepID=UPI001C0BF405|nr:polysaccharide pyruvyl transferase family protein [Polynucleobacter sp. AM-26B4]